MVEAVLLDYNMSDNLDMCQRVVSNAQAIFANRFILGDDVTIELKFHDEPFRGCAAALFEALDGHFPAPGKVYDGHKVYGDCSKQEQYARCDELSHLILEYDEHIGSGFGIAGLMDHCCVVSEVVNGHRQQIGVLLSPYVGSDSVVVTAGEIIVKVMDLLFPDYAWRDEWDVVSVPRFLSMYYPDNSITCGIVKSVRF